jgi:hypothetical protein
MRIIALISFELLDPLSAASTNGAVNQTHAKTNTIQQRIMSETMFSILRNGAELGKQRLSEIDTGDAP